MALYELQMALYELQMALLFAAVIVVEILFACFEAKRLERKARIAAQKKLHNIFLSFYPTEFQFAFGHYHSFGNFG